MTIEEIRKALDSGIMVEYTAHCLKRMLERNISRKDIIWCIYHGEIIEQYPLKPNNIFEKSVPCCLVLGTKSDNTTVIHVVVGYDKKKVLIITGYYPNNELWLFDRKTRGM